MVQPPPALTAVLQQCYNTLQVPENGISGVSVDTRTLQRGNLFFALPGANVDGHTFLAEAKALGAAAAIVHTSYQGIVEGLPLLRVPDVLIALQTLAKTFLAQQNAKVIALTGSVGKTTTKEFVSTLLATTYRIAKSPGNSNSQIGLPLTLLNEIHGDEDYVVVEMGMDKPGQLPQLIDIAPPHFALITLVTAVHAVNFDSIEEIARAKATLFSHPTTQAAFLDRDIPLFHTICEQTHCPTHSYSIINPLADFFLESKNNQFLLATPHGDLIPFQSLPFPGPHFAHNFLAAALLAHEVGVSWETINTAIPSLHLPEKRFEQIEKKGITFVNDAYNACELSMKAALSSLPEPRPGGKKIAVLAEMLELGTFSKNCHQRVGEHALHTVDALFCLGKAWQGVYSQWKREGKPIVWAENRQELLSALRQTVTSGDVVLVKGSSAYQMWRVISEL